MTTAQVIPVTTHALRFAGIQPDPLASYLKGIAVLRAIGEQVDPSATGCWRNGCFEITSRLTEVALVQFFLTDWAPTPLVAPWNGGSGFGPKDQKSGIAAIAATTDHRFASYREVIAVATQLLATGATDDKPRLIAELRARLPDEGIRWLDAAIVLTADRPTYPPLLGTGGNDGRLEFSNNQMQRLNELLISPTDSPLVEAQLREALFATPAPRSKGASIGQFAPGQAGGANTGMGFNRDSLINPWDFVLALEGAVGFAASASRAFDAASGAAFPFFVRASSAGYASASSTEETRGELWMPLWNGGATAAELTLLIAEGRAWVDQRRAESAADFARAIRQLGVARGVSTFQRFVLSQRNGLAFFATSAGQYRVAQTPEADPLSPLDAWLERANRIVASDDTCPSRFSNAVRGLQGAILEPADSGLQAPRLLLALGTLSSAGLRSRTHKALEMLPPMPTMNEHDWERLAHSSVPEWRLAFLLSQGGLRSELQPISNHGRLRWETRPREAELSSDVPVIARLLRVGHRRLLLAPPRYVAPVPRHATIADLLAMLDPRLDLGLLSAALDATILTMESPPAGVASDHDATRLALGIQLCMAAFYGPPGDATEWPLPADMLHALSRGQGEHAVRLAVRHLQSRDHPTELPPAALPDTQAQRLACALLLPLSPESQRAVWRAVSPLHLNYNQ